VAVEKEPMVPMSALSELAAAIAGLQQKPELKEGDPEYTARQRAEGWFDDFFGKKVYQNAYEAQARGLSEEVRRRVSQLQPGTYLKGRVKVENQANGDIVRILYPVSGDNLMINQTKWRDFSDLVNQIWEEMQVAA